MEKEKTIVCKRESGGCIERYTGSRREGHSVFKRFYFFFSESGIATGMSAE